MLAGYRSVYRRGVLFRSILLTIVLTLGVAHADPALRSRIVLGGTLEPEQLAVSITAGWNGSNPHALGSALVEAALWQRLSVIAGAELVPAGDDARPTAGAAYQFLDPRRDPVGLRVTAVYKPEGLTEPEGEFETTAIVSRPFGLTLASVAVAYGQDFDGNERDGELGASVLANVLPELAVGALARGRSGLGSHPVDEPTWDVVGGVVSTVALGHYRGEILLGAAAQPVAGMAQSGVLGMIAVGADI